MLASLVGSVNIGLPRYHRVLLLRDERAIRPQWCRIRPLSDFETHEATDRAVEGEVNRDGPHLGRETLPNPVQIPFAGDALEFERAHRLVLNARTDREILDRARNGDPAIGGMVDDA